MEQEIQQTLQNGTTFAMPLGEAEKTNQLLATAKKRAGGGQAASAGRWRCLASGARARVAPGTVCSQGLTEATGGRGAAGEMCLAECMAWGPKPYCRRKLSIDSRVMVLISITRLNKPVLKRFRLESLSVTGLMRYGQADGRTCVAMEIGGAGEKSFSLSFPISYRNCAPGMDDQEFY